MCLFHKGDEILAINDLHAGSVEEVDMYLSKSLKNEVISHPPHPQNENMHKTWK